MSVTGREQQLIFRHRPGSLEHTCGIGSCSAEVSKLRWAKRVHGSGCERGEAGSRPSAATELLEGEHQARGPDEGQGSRRAECVPNASAAFCCRTGSVGQEIVPATAEEVSWIQEVLDGTYKKKSTRDRSGGPLADRFVVVSALRSEHPGQAARNHSRVEDPAGFANVGTCDRLVGQVCRKRNRATCIELKDGHVTTSISHYAEVATDIKKRSTVEIVEPKTMKACSAFQERPAEEERLQAILRRPAVRRLQVHTSAPWQPNQRGLALRKPAF